MSLKYEPASEPLHTAGAGFAEAIAEGIRAAEAQVRFCTLLKRH